MKIVKVAYVAIKFNEDFYPRQSIDRGHVNRIADAIRAGAEMPPIVLDKATNLCVDGFHRASAYLKVHGKGATVPATYKTYPSRKAMILEAARLNAGHGRSLNTCDRVHFYTICSRHGIPIKDCAGALQVQEKVLEKLCTERLAFRSGAKKNNGGTKAPDVPLKTTVKHMAGKTLTRGKDGTI